MQVGRITRSIIVLRFVLILSCVALAPPALLLAQTTAAISGSIRDSSGGALPGVTVTMTPRPAGAARSAVTDGDGRYAFAAIPAGDYVLEATLAGFGRHETSVTLAAGDARALDVTLTVSPFTETVTVTRGVQDRASVPNAVSVIQADAIQSFQRRASPVEAFSGIPGFYVENRRNYSLSGSVRFAIRAPLPRSGMRGIQLLQDGVPMTLADGTTVPTNIDLGSLGRVEVLRGPSSVLYGNSAGGVISLQSEFPPANSFVVEPDVQVGSYGYRRQQIKVAGAAGRVSYLVNANSLQTDGYRQHSAADPRQANIVARTALSDATDLRAVVNLFDLPFGENASTLTLADARNNPRSVRPQAFTQGWGESASQQQTGVTLQHTFAPGHVLRATAWGQWRDVWNPIPASVVTVDRRAWGMRSEYAGAATLAGLPITWTTGADVSSQRDDRAEYANLGVPATGGPTQQGALQLAQLEEVRSVSPFAQVTAQVASRWHLTGGMRYDRYTFAATDRFLSNGDQSGERDMSAVSPMAGVTYVPSPWLNLYANVATAYQTPTTVELSNRPTTEGGFNEELEPEDTRSVEVGVRGAIAPLRLRFEAATYTSRLENALVQFQRADEQAYFRNAGEAKRKGLETLVEWTPKPRVTSRLSYTLQDFAFGRFVAPEGDFSGKDEPGAPRHQVTADASYDAPFGLFTALRYRFVSAYPVNSANTFENWSYSVVDLRVGLDRRWKALRFRPFFTIDNIFNERYNGSAVVNSAGDRYFEPSPDRELTVGLTLTLDR